MNKMEALTSLLEKIPNLEDVEEEINIIKVAFANVDDEATDFKEKYLSLKEKYIARFRDGDNPEVAETETETNIDEAIVSSKMEDLVE